MSQRGVDQRSDEIKIMEVISQMSHYFSIHEDDSETYQKFCKAMQAENGLENICQTLKIDNDIHLNAVKKAESIITHVLGNNLDEFVERINDYRENPFNLLFSLEKSTDDLSQQPWLEKTPSHSMTLAFDSKKRPKHHEVKSDNVDPDLKKLNDKILGMLEKRLAKVKKEKNKVGTQARQYALERILLKIKENPRMLAEPLDLDHIKEQIRTELKGSQMKGKGQSEESLIHFNQGVKIISTSKSKFRKGKESRFKQMEDKIHKMTSQYWDNKRLRASRQLGKN